MLPWASTCTHLCPDVPIHGDTPLLVTGGRHPRSLASTQVSVPYVLLPQSSGCRPGLPRASHSFPLCPAHVHSLSMPVLPTGWGERSWEVHYAKAAHGGPGPCPRYQACPQVRDAPAPTHRELHALSTHSQLPLPLHSGAFSFHFASRNLKIGYFSQHHVEQLDLNVSAVELLARKFPGTLG